MGKRVYILLDVVEGKAEEAAKILRGSLGVKLVDVLEGQPDVLIMLEARSRRRLAELTNQALALVEGITEDLQVLPAINGNKSQYSALQRQKSPQQILP